MTNEKEKPWPPLKADQSEIVQLTTRIMELEDRVKRLEEVSKDEK